MGQFKPMVKMTTNEPSVMLKLKKGGKVAKEDAAESKHKKMAGGGAMSMLGMTPAFVGRPAVNAPVKSPGKPSMAKRKKAMAAKKPAMAKNPMPKEMPMMPPMKEGGKADKAQDKAMVKKAFKQHDAQEHKGGKGTKLTLKKGGQAYASGGSVTFSPMATPATAKPTTANRGVGEYVQTAMRTASKGPKGFAKGGAVKTVEMSTAKKKGDNGFATGGVAMANAGGFKKGGMMDGGKACATGGVAMANAGGYATGGVAMANAGGYKDGGKTSKKAYATGGTVDSGKPVAMQEGNKSVPAPKRQQNFSGTYKNGGEVAKKAMGGRMGPKPAQTIRTAPIGSSQATRDLFASRGKTPSYAKGGEVPKMAFGGLRDAIIPKKILAGPVQKAAPPAPAPSGGGGGGGGFLGKAFGSISNAVKPNPAPSGGPKMTAAVQAESDKLMAMQAQQAAKRAAQAPSGGGFLGKGFSNIQNSIRRKDGGKVENQPLVKINNEENAPEVKASKTDVNLKYPETMNSPQKAPKFK